MKFKKHLRKFHRWAGLITSIWVLLLAITGLLLQHSQQFNLDKKHITNKYILALYGIGNQFVAFEQDGHRLQQIDKQLIQDGTTTIKLDENISSAIFHQSHWIAITDSSVYWISLNGQIMQSMDELDDLPRPIEKIGLSSNSVIIKNVNKNFDLNTLKEVIPQSTTLWSHPLNNNDLKQEAIRLTSKDYLNFEQFIFDLHAGITSPSLLNDITAIALIFLSFSGIFLFFRKNKRSNRNNT